MRGAQTQAPGLRGRPRGAQVNPGGTSRGSVHRTRGRATGYPDRQQRGVPATLGYPQDARGTAGLSRSRPPWRDLRLCEALLREDAEVPADVRSTARPPQARPPWARFAVVRGLVPGASQKGRDLRLCKVCAALANRARKTLLRKPQVRAAHLRWATRTQPQNTAQMSHSRKSCPFSEAPRAKARTTENSAQGGDPQTAKEMAVTAVPR